MSYYTFLWRSHRGFLIFCLIFLSLFQVFVLKIAATFDFSEMFAFLLQQLPENFRALFGEYILSMMSYQGVAAFGFNHPLVLATLSICAIVIPAGHIAGEAETGTLELLLSFPLSRTKLLFDLYLSAVAFLFIIILCAVSSSLFAIHLFHQLTTPLLFNMLKIGCNLWLLFVFFMSLTLVFSTFSKEGNKVGIRAAAVILVLYLLHYLSSLWQALEFIIPLNIFSYYQPEDLMSGQRSFLQHVTVLLSAIIICQVISFVQFKRRDIPG